jgi:hypothetical protein
MSEGESIGKGYDSTEDNPNDHSKDDEKPVVKRFL